MAARCSPDGGAAEEGDGGHAKGRRENLPKSRAQLTVPFSLLFCPLGLICLGGGRGTVDAKGAASASGRSHETWFVSVFLLATARGRNDVHDRCQN